MVGFAYVCMCLSLWMCCEHIKYTVFWVWLHLRTILWVHVTKVKTKVFVNWCQRVCCLQVSAGCKHICVYRFFRVCIRISPRAWICIWNMSVHCICLYVNVICFVGASMCLHIIHLSSLCPCACGIYFYIYFVDGCVCVMNVCLILITLIYVFDYCTSVQYLFSSYTCCVVQSR